MANSIYADALVLNHTVKNRKAATINGEQVGVSNFAQWKNACNTAFEAFYRYQKNCVDVAIGTESKADTTAAFSALQTILDLVGEVNGHSLTKSLEMLTILSSYAVKDKNEYAGEALTVSSNLKDLRKSLKNVHTGMNEEYVRSLERQIAEAEERLSILSKQSDSATKYKTRNSEAAFRNGIETTLAEFIEKQSAKTWEELEAEKAAKRAAQRARHKAQRQAQAQ